MVKQSYSDNISNYWSYSFLSSCSSYATSKTHFPSSSDYSNPFGFKLQQPELVCVGFITSLATVAIHFKSLHITRHLWFNCVLFEVIIMHQKHLSVKCVLVADDMF